MYWLKRRLDQRLVVELGLRGDERTGWPGNEWGN